MESILILSTQHFRPLFVLDNTNTIIVCWTEGDKNKRPRHKETINFLFWDDNQHKGRNHSHAHQYSNACSREEQHIPILVFTGRLLLLTYMLIISA